MNEGEPEMTGLSLEIANRRLIRPLAANFRLDAEDGAATRVPEIRSPLPPDRVRSKEPGERPRDFPRTYARTYSDQLTVITAVNVAASPADYR